MVDEGGLDEVVDQALADARDDREPCVSFGHG
jgi:hypothetical protein